VRRPTESWIERDEGAGSDDNQHRDGDPYGVVSAQRGSEPRREIDPVRIYPLTRQTL